MGDELNNMDLHIILFGLAKVSFSFGLLVPKNPPQDVRALSIRIF